MCNDFRRYGRSNDTSISCLNMLIPDTGLAERNARTVALNAESKRFAKHTLCKGATQGALCCLMLAGVTIVQAQSYPERPLRIVTSGAGGADVVARLIAPALSADLGRTVNVDNQPAGIEPI